MSGVEMKTKESELKKAIHLKEMMHKSIMDHKVRMYAYTYILDCRLVAQTCTVFYYCTRMYMYVHFLCKCRVAGMHPEVHCPCQGSSAAGDTGCTI